MLCDRCGNEGETYVRTFQMPTGLSFYEKGTKRRRYKIRRCAECAKKLSSLWIKRNVAQG